MALLRVHHLDYERGRERFINAAVIIQQSRWCAKRDTHTHTRTGRLASKRIPEQAGRLFVNTRTLVASTLARAFFFLFFF